MSVPSAYTGKIHGHVFEDIKANGLLDKKDQGLGGVKVQLINFETQEVVASTVTDFRGHYSFDSITSHGFYNVKFINPDQSNYRFSTKSLSPKFKYDPYFGGKKINAGVYKTAKIGDRVFHDIDGDGKQDGNEAGLDGIKVQLLNQNGGIVSTTETNAQGNYLFSNLTPGMYQVKFEAKDGYHFSPKDVGKDPSIDSDGPVSDLIWLQSGEWNDKIDAGLYRPAQVGDKVWLDEDGNGIQDSNEPGVAGVEVKLTRPNGRVVETTTTDSEGNYLFDKVRPGRYRVMFNNPNDQMFKFTTQDAGQNDQLDSDANPNTGQTKIFTLKSGQSNLTLDAGLMKTTPPKAAVGDFVFNDLDRDGIQDAGEDGIEGIGVKLQSPNGETVATSTTDAEGKYLFDGVDPGNYKIMFNLPVGFTVSPQNQGQDDSVDSDANPNSGMTPSFNLEAGEVDLTWDLGLYKPTADIDIEKLVRTKSQDFPQGDVCETLGKPKQLTFEYSGGGADAVNTAQSGKKFNFEGIADDDTEAYVVVSKGKKSKDGEDVLFAGELSVGESFEVSSEKFDSNTRIQIFDQQGGPLLQTIDYHTSCSAPIVLGDVLGGVTLTGYQGEDGGAVIPLATDFIDADTPSGPEAIVGSSVEFRFEVTNPGEVELSNVTVTDDQLDNLKFEGGDTNNDGLLDVNETWIYSATDIAKAGQQKNTATVIGFGDGVNVTDSDIAHYFGKRKPIPQGDVCETLGKPKALTFTSTGLGADAANTAQSGKKFSVSGGADSDGSSYIVVNSDDTIFSGTVSEGESFTVTAEKFKSNTEIEIYDDLSAFQSGVGPIQTIDYHTSCSAPIVIGDILGGVQLTGYVGEKGSASMV